MMRFENVGDVFLLKFLKELPEGCRRVVVHPETPVDVHER
jgi:hypothetical protein